MKFETFDDKYLYDKINRYEMESVDINSVIKQHRKFWLFSSLISLALFFLFLSFSFFIYGSVGDFFANHLKAKGFKFALNIFYLFLLTFIIFLVLFLLTFSSMYAKIVTNKYSQKLFYSFKKINYDDFSHVVDFDDQSDDYFNKLIKVNTFYKFDFKYCIRLNSKNSKFVFYVCKNFYSKVFNLKDIKSVEINYNGKKFTRNDLSCENEFYSLDEVFKGYSDELDLLHNCNHLSINILMNDSKIFPIIFVNEQLKRKRMLKEYSVMESFRMIYNVLSLNKF